MNQKYTYYIGIDTGTHTGIAVWHRPTKDFFFIGCMAIHKAMEEVKEYYAMMPGGIFVRVEDARQRKHYGNQAGTHALQGAGSIKRDAVIWQDFLTDLGVPFEMIHPIRGATKLSADLFRAVTGWQGVTNVHGRDAALMVYKM